MKKLLTLALALSTVAALAQKTDNVGIGTKNPDPSALLDLSSTTKGLLLPRMTQAQRDAIKNPVAGLIVYQVDQVVGTYTYDGNIWQPSTAKVGSALSAGFWDKQGNGGVDNTDFLGTTNYAPIRIRTAGTASGVISPDGNLFLGFESGQSSTPLGSSLLEGFNVGIGYRVMKNTIPNLSAVPTPTGVYNVGVGSQALRDNTTGYWNMAVGTSTLLLNQTGSQNMALGQSVLASNVSGNENTGVGALALYNATGSRNLAMGAYALFANTGSDNTAIGWNAGYNEPGSNMLYIANSSTPNPLIKGSFGKASPFQNTYLRINVKPTPGSPTPATTGYMAIGDFDTAPGGAGAGGLGLPASFASGAYRLYVQDGILTEKLKVALRNGADWADYVFAPNYKLMPLEEVETFVNENKHLPNVPSADELEKSGLDFVKTSAKLMEKVEELTLYMIDLNKQLKQLKEENEALKARIK